jgi:nitrate/nitrite transport system ATP-binding protein
MSTHFLSVESLKKVYPSDQRHAEPAGVRRHALPHRPGEFVCIIGHSGCGKTTILNVLAGLEEASAGNAFMDSREVKGPSLDRGVVFQSHALMPWMSVLGNVAFAVKSKWPDWPKDKIAAHASQYLEMVGLGHAIHKKPAELSGGMKQRVGIARAFAIQPKMLLLDEPFGALDALTRGTIQDELLKIVQATHQTVFMITHDVDEAILLADKIMLMSNGPHAKIAEIVEVTMPRSRTRAEHPPRPAVLQDPQPPGGFPRQSLEDLRRRGCRDLPRPEKPAAGAAGTRNRTSTGGGIADPTVGARATPGCQSLNAQSKEKQMNRNDVTEMIIAAKIKKGLKWEDVAKKIGLAKEWVTAGCLGQMTFDKKQAATLGKIFGLPPDAVALLQVVPYKGSLPTAVPTDPLIYRFYELISVYGTTFKELIHEEFGDGIMSAIDFKMDMKREPNPNGDRVNIVMSGKFLPYKTY